MKACLHRWLFPVCPACGEDLYLIGFGMFCFSDRCRRKST
jgi:hypothetical protein